MKHIAIALIATILCGCSSITPGSCEEVVDSVSGSLKFTPILVEFLGTRDPEYIKIKLPNDVIITTTFSDVELETLANWKIEPDESGKPRTLTLYYNNKEGVRVRDEITGITFSLTGVLKNHPIDQARVDCEYQKGGRGRVICTVLALDAWDTEVNRAYELLGGDTNESLKKAQEAWGKYIDAQVINLQSEYGGRGGSGSMWSEVSVYHMLAVTKERANLLKSIIEF